MSIEDATEYRQVTVRMKHQGVCLRGYKLGKEIGTKQQSFVKKGQFILSKIDARNGAFGIIPDDLEGAIITNDFLTYDVNEKELNIQLFRLLTSQPTFDDICNKASTGTTNRKRLSEREFLAQEITVPPIEEQDSFINHFKKIQALQENTKIELAIQADLIAKLRSSILSDAVSGRLAPLDSTDEPASMLLEQIKAEKEGLIKEGKLKRDKPLAPVTADEIPYELPEGWSWCRFQTITTVITCGIASTPKYYDSGRVFLSAKNIKPYKFLPNEHKYIDEGTYQKIIANAKPEKNDILLTRVGAGIGESAIIDVDLEFAYYVSLTLIKPLHKYINSKYLLHFLNSPEGIKNAISYTSGKNSSQGNLNVNKVREYLIPFPPLAEQNRIVNKVEELMVTCDALEAEVAKSRMETDQLMQTILKEAFDGTE